MTLLWLALACGGPADHALVDASAAAIGGAECAVCGMTVGEQLAPRGQVVFRDGTHQHVCSVQELRALVQAPSSRGAPVAVYVEALPDDFDVAAGTSAVLPWITVEEGRFVYGASRPMVMGEPALVFADDTGAAAAAHALDAKVLRWPALRDTPFNLVPSEWRTP